MAGDVQTPRSRGSLCGLILILLGGWGGVAPFIGPSIGYGFTPDVAWHSTPGRLDLSAIPGAIVVVAGLFVLVTRNRGIGGFFAMAAAVGGGWFIAGASLIKLLPPAQVASITTGAPIETGTSRVVLTGLAFYAGTGALIVFFSALALGRFSIAAYRDHVGPADDFGDAAGLAGAGAPDYSAYQAYQDTSSYSPGQPQYPSGETQDYPGQGYPQTPAQDPFGRTQDALGSPLSSYPPAQAPFPPAQFPATPDPFRSTPTSYPQPATPESTTTERTFGQQESDPPAR